MTLSEGTRLAVLIDADNATASVLKELLEEVARFGTASVRRVYGDWTTPRLNGWGMNRSTARCGLDPA